MEKRTVANKNEARDLAYANLEIKGPWVALRTFEDIETGYCVVVLPRSEYIRKRK